MVNLLRFNDVAKYPPTHNDATSAPMSGRAAYHHYMRLASPLVAKMGVQLAFEAQCRQVLIGPADEAWDAFLLVRYPSIAAFLSLTGDGDYKAMMVHRAAALADSRLVLMTEKESEISSIAATTQHASAKL
jgi:uncharacterized protein (DUF1330 family)